MNIVKKSLLSRTTSCGCRCLSQIKERTSLVHIENQFDSVPDVKKDKDAFFATINMFKEKRGRTHVEFINTALKYMKDYGVHKDLDAYKALIDIFPKGKMIPQSTFQKVFLHYPMQQNCCVKVLDEMEWNCVQPDKEIHEIVVNAFGEWNFATKKIKRMLYWMPKLKHSNKYLDRRLVENKKLSPEEMAGIALKMMSRDPATSISLLKLSGESEPGWMVTALSPSQSRLIQNIDEGEEDNKVPFLILSMKPTSPPASEFKEEKLDEDYSNWFNDWSQRRTTVRRTIHEQANETILALGALHRLDNVTSFRWVEQLQKTHENLATLCVRSRVDGVPIL